MGNRIVKYDFIEIGTCDFNTLIEGANDNTIGISIEPIKYYLDKPPNKKNILKLNLAVVESGFKENFISIYYVPIESINKFNLGLWLRGCNSIDKPHEFHTNYHDDFLYWHRNPEKEITGGRNLISEGIVEIKKVGVISYQELIKTYNITDVDFIKIDVEGYDTVLVNDILKYHKEENDFWPKKIQFESCRHCNQKEIKNTIEKAINLGYSLVKTDLSDTILQR